MNVDGNQLVEIPASGWNIKAGSFKTVHAGEGARATCHFTSVNFPVFTS
jgi:hypothetical protein